MSLYAATTSRIGARCSSRDPQSSPSISPKNIVGTAILAGALGAAALGLGAGLAQADLDWVDPNIPGVPGLADWVPNTL